MGETSDQIAHEIEQARAELGTNLQELENRFQQATDWRQHYQKQPFLMIGLAFVVGLLLGRTTVRP